VYFGFGTKLSPKPRRLVMFGGAGMTVHKLCTAAFVQRAKKCVFGMFAIMSRTLWSLVRLGSIRNPYAFLSL
jgi:hypothetical protein